MGTSEHSSGRVRVSGAWAATTGLLIGAVVIAAPSSATAAIDPADQLCFEVSGPVGGAAIVNLTPLGGSGRGFGSLISSDVKADPPLTANVNYTVGSIDPNVAFAPIGIDGEICYQNSTKSSVELVADHLGTIDADKFTPATENGAAERLVDTREGLGGDRVPASGQLCFEVSGPAGGAAIVNITPVGADGRGFGQLISSDVKDDPPLSANVNYDIGTIDPNVAISPIGDDGQVCYQNSTRASVEIIADYLGTITAGAFTPANADGGARRLVDTREDLAGSRVDAGGQLCFNVSSQTGSAAVVNITPVGASGRGFGSVISSDVRANPPLSANVNYRSGSVDPNVAITPIGGDGQVCYQNSTRASVEVIADHLGTIDRNAFTPAEDDGGPKRVVDTRIGELREFCERPRTLEYDTATAQTTFGLSSRAYEIDPGDAPAGTPLNQIGNAEVDFNAEMSCWKLVAAIRDSNDGLLGLITDTELIVAENTQTGDLAVAFRGTELNLFDILSDIDAVRSDWTLPDDTNVDDAVHRGFKNAYEVVREQLLNVLRQQGTPGPGERIYFTGHSLGGAIATLAAVDLVDELEGMGYRTNDVVTYTFGAPRSMSKEMATHHDTFTPHTFAVANPRDPVPQVPTAIGDDNPYSHVASMASLVPAPSALLPGGANEVRVDVGDGRTYRGCVETAPTVAFFAAFHPRGTYNSRLVATQLAAPTVEITVAPFGLVTAGRLQMRWSNEAEGPCDRVAMYRTSGTPSNSSTPIRTRDISLDTNNVHSTTVVKGDNYWVGYLNIFGEIVSKRRYVPSTPRVWMTREDRLGPDTINLHWSVSDPGSRDLVVLFKTEPCAAGPDGYYRGPVGRVESDPLNSLVNPSKKLTFVGSNPNDWWVAYIMEDGDGNERILSTRQGMTGFGPVETCD